MIDVQIKVPSLNGAFNDLFGKIRGELLHRIGDKIASQARHRVLHSKTEPGGIRSGRGRKWRPRKDGSRRSLLKASGRLAASFRYRRVDVDEGIVENVTPYFIFHQRGTKRIPRRAMLGVDAHDAREIDRLIDAFVRRRMR